MNDDELLDGFTANTLESFPHEDHLRVVHLLVLRYGEELALQKVSTGIRAMAQANGNPGAFHVTRTVAWTRLVAAATTDGTANDSRDFLAQHPELIRRNLLDDYYAPGTLTTDAARDKFVEPQLRPLP